MVRSILLGDLATDEPCAGGLQAKIQLLRQAIAGTKRGILGDVFTLIWCFKSVITVILLSCYCAGDRQ